MKSLKRHGRAYHANDINEALFLMADKDFDYYFVDADIPNARAFIKHIEHDPQLVPPRAVVLLTDNEEEDCEAWSADAFITKSKIYEDLPYIFSHLKGKHTERANVVRIAPDRVNESDNASSEVISRKSSRRERAESVRPADEKGYSIAPSEQVTQKQEHPGGKREFSTVGNDHIRRLRLVAVAFLIVMAGLWLFVWGPFGGNADRHRSRTSGRKNVAAETADSAEVKNGLIDTRNMQGSSTVVQPENSPSPVTPPAATVPDGSTPQPAAIDPDPAPPSERVNHTPTVYISGPVQISARETATYSVVASDCDGDSLSYSWGSSSKSTAWSVPGLYSISVTVTDSHGASSNASISVRVI